MQRSESPLTKAGLAATVNQIKSYVRERVFDAEIKLLRAFADYDTATSIGFHKLEADVSTSMPLDRRLSLVETKLTNLKIE